MLLTSVVILILVLITALIVLILEEWNIKKSKVPRGTVKEYWSGNERRQSRRINTSLIVRYSIEKRNHIKLNGRVKDVSIDGMRLLVNEKLKMGVLLSLEFDLPDTKDIIVAEGRVVWADGKFDDRDELGRRVFHTGIQFLDIKPKDKNRLVAYIEKIAEKT